MIERPWPIIWLIALLMGIRSFADGPMPSTEPATQMRFRGACTNSEYWNYSNAMDSSWRQLYSEFLTKRISVVRGFSEAMALRQLVQAPEAKLFGEYWASRALLNGKLVHMAQLGFSSIAAREDITGESQIVQQAAMQCLVEIQKQVPSMELSEKVVSRLYNLPRNSVTWEAALVALVQQIGGGKPEAEITRTLRYLQGGAQYQSLGNALWSASRGRHAETIAFFNQLPPDAEFGEFKRFANALHLILARAYFGNRQFELAVNELKKVQKQSNELSHALSELAWAHLRAEKYQEAVGTVTHLLSGGLKRTFAPEAQMITAIAFNELCQYPESLKAMQSLRKEYGPIHAWLHDWMKQYKSKKNPEAVYRLALDHLRGVSQVPMRIANEWIRSPLFISRQEEINTIFSERRAVAVLGQQGAQEVRRFAQDILDVIRVVKPMYADARKEIGEDKALPERVESKLNSLRKMVTTYRRLRRGAEPWKRILANFNKVSPAIEKRLVGEIGADIAVINERMLAQLNDVADNTHFIEVEIFTGASQDMVWQNAHPDFEKVSKELSQEDSQKPAAATVWDWGKVSGGVGGSQEIWEDELGSYRAELSDNCANKDRYITVKKQERTPASAAESTEDLQ